MLDWVNLYLNEMFCGHKDKNYNTGDFVSDLTKEFANRYGTTVEEVMKIQSYNHKDK